MRPMFKIVVDCEVHSEFDDFGAARTEFDRLRRLSADPTLWMAQWCMVSVPQEPAPEGK